MKEELDHSEATQTLNKSMSRRRFLSRGALTVGAAGVAASGSLGLLTRAAAAQTCATVPGTVKHPWGTWGYTPLDPDICGERAYQGWWVKACCYAVVDGIIGELQDALGTPYTNIDPAIFAFGAGGVNGWGTICGTALGAAVSTNMVAGATGSTIGSHLLGYYSSQTLPDYDPVVSQYAAKGGTIPGYTPPMVMPTSCSDSPLCHLSVSKWLVAANAAAASDPTNYAKGGNPANTIVTGDVERKERCARLAGAMARKTAEMLNAAYNGGAWDGTYPTYPKIYSPGWSGPGNGAPHQGNCVDCH